MSKNILNIIVNYRLQSQLFFLNFRACGSIVISYYLISVGPVLNCLFTIGVSIL